MSLIIIVDLNCQLGRPKLFQIFLFWFEEDVIYFHGGFKLKQKTYSDKEKNHI